MCGKISKLVAHFVVRIAVETEVLPPRFSRADAFPVSSLNMIFVISILPKKTLDN